MAHDIDFWTLVECDVAGRRLDDAKLKCLHQYRLCLEDIASVILGLSEPDGPWHISEGTRDDLRRIVRGKLDGEEERLAVIDACVPDETDPVFLDAVRRDCPRSYEYYRLYRRGVLSLV